MITLKKSDIGGEIISILTKGMYSDSKDALREYVQNSVDAKAKNIDIKIRQNNIVVQDNGVGMDFETMRNAIRLGVSDKNPKNHVGFMGIGIYSSFHICEQLIIYSRMKDKGPNRISFDFKKMREDLEDQREARFKKEISEEEFIALQKLLENNITLDTLNNEDFAKNGTRVELIGLEQDFFKSLSKFDELAEYLEKVLPLPYDPRFKWGKIIEEKIIEECKRNNLFFDIVNVKLQVNEEARNLFKPYKDEDFEPEPLHPHFIELKNGNDLFGIAWGCLNKDRAMIKNEKSRGFLVKKQGFTIGKREDMLEFFGRPVFFNRYVGEIIVLNSKLLPNASRSAFEPSPLRISYYQSLQKVANGFNDYANEYQEIAKASSELDKAIDFIKKTNAQVNYFSEDSEALLKTLFELKGIQKDLSKRHKNERLKDRKEDYNVVTKNIDLLAANIRILIDKRGRKRHISMKSDESIASVNQNLPSKTSTIKEIEFKSLIEVISSIGLELNEDFKKIFQLLDEHFIQPSKSKNEYLSKLGKLKQEIEELLEE